MRLGALVTVLLLSGCVVQPEPCITATWTEQETEFVYSLLTTSLENYSGQKPSEWSDSQKEQVKSGIHHSAIELFRVEP